MDTALSLQNIRKTFGKTVAVEGMDLVVPRGALYGVIGPNGAGKTTCIRMIMAILFQDSGTLSVLGKRSALEAKDRIGYLEEHRRGATVLLSTHVMTHAEEICEHVVMIHQGRKVLDEPVSGLRRQYDARTLLYEPLDPHADLKPIEALPGVERIDADHGGWRITLRPGSDPSALIPRVASAVPAARVELARLRLEDVFIRIVSGGLPVADTARLRASLDVDSQGATA